MIEVTRTGAGENVALVTLNRPSALNALCRDLMMELTDALLKIENDDSFSVIILTGSERAFAAGADIKEMSNLEFTDVFMGRHFDKWDTLSVISKPVIAAVNGFALGGGTELAMMCDIVYAGEKAFFGQPEISVGTIPGLGGTQRWPRFASKSVAMEVLVVKSINNAYETSLHQGLEQEKQLFQSTFATKDRQEGMNAFTEKRTAKWTNQ